MHLAIVPPPQEPLPRRRAAPAKKTPDIDWVRRAREWSELLFRERALTGPEHVLVAFAIEWAPYGGADAEAVFVKFGVHRLRFIHMLQAAMMPRLTEPRQFRRMKSALCREILTAWQPAPRPS